MYIPAVNPAVNPSPADAKVCADLTANGGLQSSGFGSAAPLSYAGTGAAPVHKDPSLLCIPEVNSVSKSLPLVLILK